MGMVYSFYIKLLYTLYLTLTFLMDLINKSKQNDKIIKFWKSIPSFVLVWQYQKTVS